MMTHDPIEDRLRASLHAAASSIAEVDPPVLTDRAPAVRPRRSFARPLALVACLLVLGGVSIAALRGGPSEALRATGTADTATTSPSPLPEGLRLLHSVDAGDDHVHELWAYQDGGTPCTVTTTTVQGVRWLGGSDCPRPPICIDSAWAEFVPAELTETECGQPPPPTFGPGAEGGWRFIHGGIVTSAADSQPGTPMIVSARLDPRVATWETGGEQPLGPFSVVRHPDDADLRYLFGLVAQGGEVTRIVLRDASATFLGEITLV